MGRHIYLGGDQIGQGWLHYPFVSLSDLPSYTFRFKTMHIVVSLCSLWVSRSIIPSPVCRVASGTTTFDHHAAFFFSSDARLCMCTPYSPFAQPGHTGRTTDHPLLAVGGQVWPTSTLVPDGRREWPHPSCSGPHVKRSRLVSFSVSVSAFAAA